MDTNLDSNLAETLAREMKQPMEIVSNANADIRRVALPPGWHLEERDDSKKLPAPLRKVATVRLRDTDSFIEYVKRHGSLTDSTVWCQADYTKGQVAFVAIINDHGEDPDKAAWRDHRAHFSPEFSEEWRRWIGSNGKNGAMSQSDFAMFLEENAKDIVSPDGTNLPSGSAMLDMASNFEAVRDWSYKSAIRTATGGVTFTLVDTENEHTVKQMQAFEKFAIGIPVFRNSQAYRIDARLRYRVTGAKLAFWYELIRPDMVLEDSANAVISAIREKTGNPFFFGDPFTS
ncbi:DUF2303 family protein [Burkholderia territorii]|uniref:DUF2303 family protein n=1 Tax=Burkholderia territorii TaxID=1503055 RepID=UPI00075591D8|nr:DUF2303 family protein [Burkholderia territorii]KWO62593.1 hypothetical protein WT98_30470 [Burkholderia territorii]